MRLLQDRHTVNGRTFIHEQCAHGAWIAGAFTAALVGFAAIGGAFWVGLALAPVLVVSTMLVLGVPALYVLMIDLCVDDIRQRRAAKAPRPTRRHDEPAWLNARSPRRHGQAPSRRG